MRGLEALSSDAKGCRASGCRVPAVTTPGKGRVSPLCQNSAAPKAAPRRSSVSCAIQKGRASPLGMGPPALGREPQAASAPAPPGTGEGGATPGLQPPDVPPAFRGGDRAEQLPGPQMGRINLGAGSPGPRCSVFSRLWAPDVGLSWGRDAAPDGGSRAGSGALGTGTGASTLVLSSSPPTPQGQEGFRVHKRKFRPRSHRAQRLTA